MRRPVLPSDVRAHWIVPVSIAVLVLNDHVLKSAWPGFVTGKLSDVAGLAFFPILLAVRTRTVRGWAIAGAITAVVFAAIKVWPAATDVYRSAVGAARWLPSAVLGWVEGRGAPAIPRIGAVTDPTDLLALPFAWTTTIIACTRRGRHSGGDTMWPNSTALGPRSSAAPDGAPLA